MRIMSLAALVRSAAVVAAAALAYAGVSIALPAPAEAAVGPGGRVITSRV